MRDEEGIHGSADSRVPDRDDAQAFLRALCRGAGSGGPRVVVTGAGPRERSPRPRWAGLPGLPHFAPKAKRAIYLFMSEGPSQMDLFDYKPAMADWFDKDLPESIRKGSV